MHYEVELALVIGKIVRDLKADDRQGALEAIKGTSESMLSVISLSHSHRLNSTC
jgi:hypothetical protein